MPNKIFSIVLCLLFTVQVLQLTAQPNRQAIKDRGAQGVDYFNIFCTGYTLIGVPRNGRVYLYRPPYKSDTVPGWKCYDSVRMPPATVATDGNIHKIIFLTDNGFYYQEGKWKDTLRFSEKFKKVKSRVWIRGTNTTERDIEFLSGEKRITYYADGQQWFRSGKVNPYFFTENRTYPLLTQKDKFLKLYNFENHDVRSIAGVYPHKVKFYRYKSPASTQQINISAIKSQTFHLPTNARSAFVYDDHLIGVCFRDKIVFYQYNQVIMSWIVTKEVPELSLKTGA